MTRLNMTAKAVSDTKQFLISEVLQNPLRNERPGIKKELSHLSRERVNKALIYVGMNSCGRIAGAGATLRAIAAYLDEHQIKADLVEGGCIGFCAAEPIVDVQLPGKARISFARVHADMVQPLLDDILNQQLPEHEVIGQLRNPIHQAWPGVPWMDEHPFFRLQQRELLDNCGLIDPLSIQEYIARGGYQGFCDSISKLTPQALCELVTASELLGRGGGAYPAGKKWLDTLKTVSDQKYLVCNAVESDPGSYMNRAIIEGNPHRLIEAVLLAAYATGASRAYIFIRKEFSLAVERLQAALEQARDYGLIGHHILESGVNIDISIREGARAFVCGEETALNNSIEGKRAMPSYKPPWPSEQGLWNKPTSVNNVETLFNVPLIVSRGAEWYKSTGTPFSKGTKVFSLSGRIKNYGTIEVPMGLSFRQIVEEIGGGMMTDKPLKAIVLGINSGSYIVPDTLDVQVDFESLKKSGSSLGSGACVVLDESTCMVDLARFYTGFFKKESCGKCIPCREGTAQLLEIMDNVTRKPADDQSFKPLERFKGVMQLRNLAAVMKDTSLCALGKSAPNAILNTLKYFKPEFDMHVFERRCEANVCRDLKTYTIDVDACTGCTACFRKCPVDAIIGSPRLPHFIVAEKCIGCGNCYEVCKFNAVIVS